MKDEWQYMGTWFSCGLTMSFFANWYVPEITAELKLPKIKGSYKFLNFDVYDDMSDVKLLGNFFYSKMVQKDFQYFNSFIVKGKLAAQCLLEYNYDYSSFDSFQVFVKNVREMMCYWLLVHFADPGIEKALMEKCKAENIEVYQAMTQIQPSGLTFMARDKALEPLVNLYREDKLQETDLQLFLDQFNWVDLNIFIGKPLNKKELLGKLASFEPLPKANILPLHLDWPELKIAEEFAFLRYHFLECLNYLAFKFRPFLTQLASQHGLTYEDFIWLMYNEILENRIPSKAVLKQRAKSIGLIVIPPEERIMSEEELRVELQKYAFRSEEVQELHGMPASPGSIITGIAKVIVSHKDSYKVNKGDILIASETTPDFVPAMKIAGAIITDKGGVTSHAAIVSRELGVPCVIGTKVATKVFKDGDKLEVDAVKGLVRLVRD